MPNQIEPQKNEGPVAQAIEETEVQKKLVGTKSVIGFSIGELIATLMGAITLITVLVTFFVSYYNTLGKVDTLSKSVDSTNAKIDRIIERLDRQGVALDAIVERDTSLQNYIRRRKERF